MIFSHGQASFESGFSISGSIMVKNLHEESFIAQQRVYDSVNSLGGIKKIDTVSINYKMLKSVKDSDRNYKVGLDKRKEVDKRKQEMIK